MLATKRAGVIPPGEWQLSNQPPEQAQRARASGKNIAMNPPEPPAAETAAAPIPPPQRFRGWLFTAVLLAAPVLTILAALAFPKNQDLAPSVAMCGSVITGIVAGMMLGRRFGRNLSAQISLSFVFAVIMVPVCFVMSCFGCVVGGFQLNLH